jgi:hypothetical protein
MAVDIKPPPFKTCSMCKACWETCREFVEDPSLALNGYFADFTDPNEGLILVTHRVAGCGSTLGIKAGQLEQLYTGPKYSVHNAGNPDCGGHCLTDNDFSTCSATCEMRWIREVMQLLKEHRYPEELMRPPAEEQSI